MWAKDDSITVLIGASETAEALRRNCVRDALPHVGSAGHLRGLRREMTREMTEEREELVIVCVALDNITLRRHGGALRGLLADLRRRPGVTRSVGLLTKSGLTPQVAEFGCDVYVDGSNEAERVIGLLRAEHGRAAVTRCTSFGSPPPAGDRWRRAAKGRRGTGQPHRRQEECEEPEARRVGRRPRRRRLPDR